MEDKNKFDSYIKRVGGIIPHPFVLFLSLTIVVIISSFFLSEFGYRAVDIINDEVIEVNNILSLKGIVYVFENMIDNFIQFPALGVVIFMTLGFSVAEKSGFIDGLMRFLTLRFKNKYVVTFIIMLVGVCGNIVSDASAIIIPLISASVFISLKRNPIIALIASFSAVNAGFTANLIITGTDALITGITNKALEGANSSLSVAITDNFYFMAISAIVLSIGGTILTELWLSPKFSEYNNINNTELRCLSLKEKSSLRKSFLFIGIFIFILILLIAPKDSFLRNQETKSIINSPFLNIIVPIITINLIISGYIYGKGTGVINNIGDVPRIMSDSIKNISMYIVVVFSISQFISVLNLTNIPKVLSINVGNFINKIDIGNISLIIIFIIFMSFLNLFISSGSAKWSLVSPVFVPLFDRLGFTPAFTQIIYRIGDSSTNSITPLIPYMPIFISYINKYDDRISFVKVLKLLIPYSILFLFIWIVLVLIFYIFNLQIGPSVYPMK